VEIRPAAPAATPGPVDVTVRPAASTLRDAAEQLRLAHYHYGLGRKEEARQEFTEAARLYRLAAERGGSDAAAARQGGEVADRGLEALKWAR